MALVNFLLIKLVSLRDYLPGHLQPKVPEFTHGERATIITTIRALHGGGYPHYTDDMDLPPGVHAPIPGSMHADIIESAGDALAATLMSFSTTTSLVEKIRPQVADLLRLEMEAQGMEYQLANCFKRTYKYRVSKVNALYAIADEWRAITCRTVAKFLNQIPESQGRMTSFIRNQLCEKAGNAVRQHILQLLYL